MAPTRTANDREGVVQKSHPPTSATLTVMLLLFAASGCAALIYQVVWLERLSLAIGSSAMSLGVVLATFMGGLGLGSLLASRLGPGRSPLRRYALIELAIGVLGIVTLAAIPLLGGAYAALAGGGAFSLGLRLVVAALALLPATLLMGATLPVVAAWVGNGVRSGAWIGWLYAANTIGGVLGAVVAGFYLLRLYDAHVATYVAVALNLGVAAAASALARRRAAERVVAVDAPRTSPARGVRAIYVATALSGMTALAAEVLWTRHLSLLLGGTVYTFALILAVFLFGLGLGSAAGAALGTRVEPRAALAFCQSMLAVAMAAAAYALARSLPYWPIDVELPTTASVALQLDLLRAAYVALPAALLWGASFPLALAAAIRAGDEPRRAVGRLYAANTAGAIVGALATTFVLVAVIGSQRAQQVLILLSAAAAVLLLATHSGAAARRFAAGRGCARSRRVFRARAAACARRLRQVPADARCRCERRLRRRRRDGLGRGDGRAERHADLSQRRQDAGFDVSAGHALAAHARASDDARSRAAAHRARRRPRRRHHGGRREHRPRRRARRRRGARAARSARRRPSSSPSPISASSRTTRSRSASTTAGTC